MKQLGWLAGLLLIPAAAAASAADEK